MTWNQTIRTVSRSRRRYRTDSCPDAHHARSADRVGDYYDPVAEVIVCGAVGAGLAAAATLTRAGVATIVLERSDWVGASWRARYDGLRLNTPAWVLPAHGHRSAA